MKYNYLKEYYEKIMSGEIIAGKELIKTLRKLINLSPEEYYVDSKAVDVRINFIEKFIKHTKSPFSGKPFILQLWQKAFIEAVFGIKNIKTGFRKFKKIILLIARKNGKSTFCSALVITELFLGPKGSNICISSNDDAQANIILDEIKDCLELSPALKKRVHKNLKGVFTKWFSKIFKISERTKNKEGRNLYFVVLDESHEMKNNKIAKALEESTSTQDESLFINITTEGFIEGYLDEELEKVRKVNDGEEDDESLLGWLYTQDSTQEIYQDKSSWYKSNPSLGVTKKISYLENEINTSKYSVSDRVFMLAKDFNIKQNSAQAWLMKEDVEQIEEYELEEFKGAYALAAIDLAETTDLCNAKLLFIRKRDKKKCILSKYFLPEEKIKKSKEADYKKWVKNGFIDVTPGYENDFDKIVEWFLKIEEEYDIHIFRGGYDRWHSQALQKLLKQMYGKDGDEEVFQAIPQKFEYLSEPMNLLELELKNKMVLLNKNPIDEWCLLNTAVEFNKIGLQRPVKMQQSLKIDGAVVLIMLYFLYLKYKKEIFYLNEIEV